MMPWFYSQYENPGPRSNNQIEGYNSKLNKYIGKHTNFWSFINRIQSEETEAALQYIRINNGTFTKRTRNKVDIERDLTIERLKCDFLMKKIDIDELISKLSDSVHDYSDNS